VSEQSAGREARVMRRLSGEDALFVYAETPSMPMHTLGTTILDPAGAPGGAFDFDRIVATVASRLHLVPPFRQRLLEVPLGLGHPVLVDDPGFRIENHLHRIAVPAPGSLRELAEIVGDIAARPLDRSQPLWEMWVVEGLSGGRIALITKMHHCMIDGASGSSQMAQLMDLEASAPPPQLPRVRWSPPPLPSALELARLSLGSRFVSPIWLGRLLLHTATGLRSRRRAQREVARGGPLPSLFERPPATRFNRAISTHRAVAYGSASLADVKRIKNAFGVTVNDAVLAACALSVRRYLEARDDLPVRSLICMVPVSLKSQQEKVEFSNKVSTLLVKLPTQLAEPEDVIEAVHGETSDAKQVFAAIEEDLLVQWLQLVPPVLAALGARLYSELDLADRQPAPVNLIVSNMLGPPVPLYFGGARVEAVYPMGPVAEGVGLNLTVLSNMGRLDIGVLACRESVPDVWEIAEGFAQAVAELGVAAEKRMAEASEAVAREGLAAPGVLRHNRA
jgi:WS/DGAT/MGAT family acyltransferase